MIKNVYFLTTLLSITASQLCHGMKNDLPNNSPIQQATILTRITAVEKPKKALYLSSNHALIDGLAKCSVVDIRTDQEIKKIYDKYDDKYGWASDISVHPNLKKFAFSSDSDGNDNHNLTIYNAITYNNEYTIASGGYIISSHFSPLDNTIAICIDDNPNVILWNYKTNVSILIDSIPNQITYDPFISFHPTKPLMYLTWKNLYSFNLETPKKTELTTGEIDYHNFLECSPDGLFIARDIKEKIIITNLNPLSSRTLIEETPSSRITNIAIHPNSKVLITLSEPSQILRYWNIDTAQPITMTQAYNLGTWRSMKSLSISPNGAKLLLVINGECMEIAIPFEVQYKDITKKAGIFAYFTLQHYRHDGNDQLPTDIRHLLITALLKASEY